MQCTLAQLSTQPLHHAVWNAWNICRNVHNVLCMSGAVDDGCTIHTIQQFTHVLSVYVGLAVKRSRDGGAKCLHTRI